MSYEKRKINRQKREKRHRFIILGLGIALLIILIFSLLNKDAKTTLPIKDVFLREIELQGVFLKNEKIFKMTELKSMDGSPLEGERVSVGTDIGNSIILNDSKFLKKELKEVQNAISTLKQTNKDKVFKNDKKQLIEKLNILIEQLQEQIHIGDYEEIIDIRKELILTNGNIKELLPQNNLLGQSIESLNDKRDKLKKEISQNTTSYKTKSSGIISYKIDGYENIFKAQNFENYTYDILSEYNEKIANNDKDKRLKTFEKFKIVDNFEWYLAIKIDNRKDIDKYSIDEILCIKYSLEDRELELKGKVVSINNSSNKSVIVLKFNKYLHDFYDVRFSKIKLVQDREESLKIPNKAIFEKDNEKGVYIKDFNGIVRFKPVELISTEGQYSFISKGDKNLLINTDGGKKGAKTVSAYDEILLKPSRFKEGQILD